MTCVCLRALQDDDIRNAVTDVFKSIDPAAFDQFSKKDLRSLTEKKLKMETGALKTKVSVLYISSVS
jgi:hypothetical protein